MPHCVAPTWRPPGARWFFVRPGLRRKNPGEGKMIAAVRLPITLFLALGLLAQSAFAAAPGQCESSPYTINVRVGLAVLPVTVTDHKKHTVSGLKEENFRVYEDGRSQEISVFEDRDAPVTVGL